MTIMPNMVTDIGAAAAMMNTIIILGFIIVTLVKNRNSTQNSNGHVKYKEFNETTNQIYNRINAVELEARTIHDAQTVTCRAQSDSCNRVFTKILVKLARISTKLGIKDDEGD